MVSRASLTYSEKKKRQHTKHPVIVKHRVYIKLKTKKKKKKKKGGARKNPKTRNAKKAKPRQRCLVYATKKSPCERGGVRCERAIRAKYESSTRGAPKKNQTAAKGKLRSNKKWFRWKGGEVTSRKGRPRKIKKM